MENEKRSYASTQVNLPENVAKHVRAAGARIRPSTLAEHGCETEAHVTVKYGLHGDDADAVRAVLENEPPVRVKLGKASLFPGTEHGDVLKIDVDSPDLHRLNAKLAAALPCTDTHPVYKPHITIAYLKTGEGAKHAGKPVPGVSGRELVLNSVMFSNTKEEKTEIPLRRGR